MKLVAACAFGLESPVKWELKDLGFESKVISPGRISFEGDFDDVCKTNLWLRTADRVLIEVLQFPAPDFDALFETVKDFDWSKWLPANARFPVTGRSRLSQLTSVPAVQRSVKKAIVESLQRYHGTNTLPEDGPEYRIDVAILNDVATLTLDTTGASLHKRGYRTSYGEAPIKETLAAAMVMLSVWNVNRPFVDPFCGSGTIAIEAAMIAADLAPGRNRSFLWQHWEQAREVSAEECSNQPANLSEIEVQISATDVDGEVLKLARANARRAGVESLIHFQQKPFDDLRSKRQFGCVITNPPYGERLSETKLLMPLYRSFPAVLQRLPTWSHFIITSMPKFEGIVQKSATRRRKLFNGRIECMYYQFLGPKPRSLTHIPNDDTIKETIKDSGSDENNQAVAVDVPATNRSEAKSDAVFGALQAKDHEQAELFSVRLNKRAKHLRKWPVKKGITCFRLYERDIPELPFVVDRYENQYHITEYERPHDRDPGRHAAWLELMKKSVAKTFDVSIQYVHLKSRRRQTGNLQHNKIDATARNVIVGEGGFKFLVNLSDYVDTGLFLDHRTTRQMVHDEAADKNFLNLFCYTGSFSVYAAAGKAALTTSVDWSNTYLDWAKENMSINGFDDSNHRFIRSGTMEFLQRLKPSEKFDLVVVDPPTFSNSKRTEDVWDVQRDYAELLQTLATNVRTAGVVYFSTNYRKFKFDESVLSDYSCRDISKQTVPEDFRNKKIHRCWKLIRI